MLIVSQLPEVRAWVGRAALAHPDRTAGAWRYAESNRPKNRRTIHGEVLI